MSTAKVAAHRRSSRAPTHLAAAVVPAFLAALLTTMCAPVSASPSATNATLAIPPTLATSRAPPLLAAVVQQPRQTGYFVGDLLTQRVLLERDAQPLTPVALPTSGRASAWFERRQVTVVTDRNSQRWLQIEYQILNAPPKLIDAKLPAWRLRVTSRTGRPPVTLDIPAVTINIAPLSLPGSPAQVGTHDLRPDRIAPPVPLTPIRRDLTLSLIALALALCAWLGWTLWRNKQASATQPFARALGEIQTLDDREPRAWQALHRAFDRTAGHVIQLATLPTLFERAPQLNPARLQIESFFAQSTQLFFGSGNSNAPSGAPAASSRLTSASGRAAGTVPDPAVFLPRTLCTELRRIERSHER